MSSEIRWFRDSGFARSATVHLRCEPRLRRLDLQELEIRQLLVLELHASDVTSCVRCDEVGRGVDGQTLLRSVRLIVGSSRWPSCLSAGGGQPDDASDRVGP